MTHTRDGDDTSLVVDTSSLPSQVDEDVALKYQRYEIGELSVELFRPLEKDLRIERTRVFVLVKAPERRN